MGGKTVSMTPETPMPDGSGEQGERCDRCGKRVAVPAVFLFRIATFWLPTLPGWVALGWLRRSQYV